jgi:eukaryotic-like serine/threonine-protein kinase
MNVNEVVITVLDPQWGERRLTYDEPSVCIVGRAYDCDIQVPSDDEHLRVSRHHCLLEINPPEVRVHDLGSTNGTFVNGQRIRSHTRAYNGFVDFSGALVNEEIPIELKDGDEVQVADPVLRLRVEVHAESSV